MSNEDLTLQEELKILQEESKEIDAGIGAVIRVTESVALKRFGSTDVDGGGVAVYRKR